MAMSHHFGPNDRDKGFSVSDLSGLTHAASAQRLSPRAEAEARFFAHIVLADLPPNSSDIEVARGRYSQFLANIFENEDGGEPDFDLDIISSCITPQRDLMLVSVRQRSTGDLILPRPDDILRLNPAQLAAHARHFEGDSFCGILFDITPQARNFLVEATPVLLPRLMRREAVRFHNGDPDSLVGELLSRFARRELGGEIRFSAALIADDEVDEGLLLLLKDPRGREYAAKIVNPGGGLLHEIEFFIPLATNIHQPSRGMARSIDLSDAFRRCHERLDYEDVRRGPTSGALQAAVEAHLRSTFARLWRKDWHIIVHGSASTGTTEEPHHHIFASIEDRNGLRIIPGLDQKTMVTSRKLGGFIIHIDETPQTGVLPSLRTALGLSRGTHLESSIEALMIHPRVMAAEVERLVNRPGESIFDGACRSLIALDLEKRGKSSPIGEITFGPFAAWAHPASKIPLRAIIAAHHHGRHLISFALDERYGVIRPESDIRIEGFFPT